MRAYLILLAASARSGAAEEKEHTLEDNRGRLGGCRRRREVLGGQPDVARAARDLYEAAAEIMRYAVTKGMGELDTDKVVAMADGYQRQRREFVDQARGTLLTPSGPNGLAEYRVEMFEVALRHAQLRRDLSRRLQRLAA